LKALRVLYFSYDGALDPLGQTQVLGYLRAEVPAVATVLVSFEKPHKLAQHEVVSSLYNTLAEEGIKWIPLRYHRNPPVLSTLWDAAVGFWTARRFLRSESVDLVHARSIVCGLMAYPLKWLKGLPVVMDTRALWVDERLESGSVLWKRLYGVAKTVERKFLEWADAIVVLSPAYRRVLESQDTTRSKPIASIPTCVDLGRFSPTEESPKYHLVYCGSLGTVYWMDGMVAFFRALRRRCPEARWLLVSQSDRSQLDSLCRKYGIPGDAYEVYRAAPSTVPGFLKQARFGIAFYREGVSSMGRCPTKLGEYLACGLPVVMNTAVGEWGELVEREGSGVLVAEDPTDVEFDRAAEQLLQLEQDVPGLGRRCRRLAERFFDLRQGAQQYVELYRQVLFNERGKDS
jgi:glycosyltransferase involved in cell wall biosynthesis